MDTSQSKINLSKDFPVGKETLYKAWIEPEQLKQWWKPLEKQLSEVTNDVKEGGRITYRFEDNNLQINGEYKEVLETEKLVYTWIWELPQDAVHKGEYLLTIIFKGDGDSSTLTIAQDNFKEEHSIQPHQQGWEKALEDLAAFLNSQK